MTVSAAGSFWTRHTGVLLVLVAVVYLIGVHHGLGPDLSRNGERWWMPNGFLTGVAPDTLGVALGLFGGIALALAWAVFRTTGSAVLRWLAIAHVVGVGLVVTFGTGSTLAWTFFHWRWTVCLLLLALGVGAALTAPLLAGAWSRLPGWAKALTYGPLFLGVVAFERNVTGTNPTLPFAISPWPTVQIFGLEVACSWLAATWLGGGAGLALLAGGTRSPGRWAAAGILAIGLPMSWLLLGSRFALLPFRAGGLTAATAMVASLLLLGALALSLRRGADVAAARARPVVLGGLLAALPLVLGQALTLVDYQSTREEAAPAVLDALQRYLDREGTYPDELEELVTAGELEEVPRPQVGFLASQRFTYQNFGTSYILEFSAPRWIQCAYNPPWADADELSEEERAELLAEDVELEGAWSCPSKPPELW